MVTQQVEPRHQPCRGARGVRGLRGVRGARGAAGGEKVLPGLRLGLMGFNGGLIGSNGNTWLDVTFTLWLCQNSYGYIENGHRNSGCTH